MASVRLHVDNMKLDMRPEATPEGVEGNSFFSAVGAVSLRAGGHTLRMGGPFFAGFRFVVISSCRPSTRSCSDRLRASTNSQQRWPIGCRCCAHTSARGPTTAWTKKNFDEAKVVDASIESPAMYSFVGRLENLPIPEPDSGDTEILSGFTLIGVWNDHLVKKRKETGRRCSCTRSKSRRRSLILGRRSRTATSSEM